MDNYILSFLLILGVGMVGRALDMGGSSYSMILMGGSLAALSLFALIWRLLFKEKQ